MPLTFCRDMCASHKNKISCIMTTQELGFPTPKIRDLTFPVTLPVSELVSKHSHLLPGLFVLQNTTHTVLFCSPKQEVQYLALPCTPTHFLPTPYPLSFLPLPHLLPTPYPLSFLPLPHLLPTPYPLSFLPLPHLLPTPYPLSPTFFLPPLPHLLPTPYPLSFLPLPHLLPTPYPLFSTSPPPSSYSLPPLFSTSPPPSSYSLPPLFYLSPTFFLLPTPSFLPLPHLLPTPLLSPIIPTPSGADLGDWDRYEILPQVQGRNCLLDAEQALQRLDCLFITLL